MPEAAADLVFWVALACCAIAQIAIIRSVLTVKPLESASEPMPVSRRATEVAWAVLPAVILGLVFWATWRAVHTLHIDARVTTVLVS